MDFFKLPLFAESWNVAYRKKAGNELLADRDVPFTVIPNSYRYWAADPFVFEKDGEVYIFAELYDYLKCHGVLGYYRLNEKKAQWKPVIEENWHLSYPFIYTDGENVYIIPESSSHEEVIVYRAVRFPDQWVRDHAVRSKVKYVDTTLFSHGGKQLALSYDITVPTLVLMDIDGDKDTAISFPDPEMRRPAGFIDGDKGIRAAQNCTEDYGKGLIFYRFEISSDGQYNEKEIQRVFPEELKLSTQLYLDGLHTYNRSENYEVVDIKTRRLNLLNLFVRLIKKSVSNKAQVFL